MKMRIKSQLYSDAEAQRKVGAILDDCGPSSAAAAVAYVNGYNPDLQASDGVAAKARATGFTEKQGVSDNGSSLPELMKTVRELGGKARPADTFAEAVEAARWARVAERAAANVQEHHFRLGIYRLHSDWPCFCSGGFTRGSNPEHNDGTIYPVDNRVDCHRATTMEGVNGTHDRSH